MITIDEEKGKVIRKSKKEGYAQAENLIGNGRRESFQEVGGYG